LVTPWATKIEFNGKKNVLVVGGRQRHRKMPVRAGISGEGG